jgi:hypothetical protein
MKQHMLKKTTAACLCVGMILAVLTCVAAMPTSPVSALPPRFTATPTQVSPPAKQISPQAGPQAGYIELDAINMGWIPLHTVVQWGDNAGNWYDVEGWRDTPQLVSNTFQTRWWVYPRDYGTGPFRWAIYRTDAPTSGTQADVPLAASQSFTLPLTSNDVVKLQVVVPSD